MCYGKNEKKINEENKKIKMQSRKKGEKRYGR
jgi:hypothetical protein